MGTWGRAFRSLSETAGRRCLLTVEWQVSPLSRLEVLWAHQWSTGGAGCPPQAPGGAITSGSADQWKGCPTWSKYSQHLLQSVHEESVHWGPTCCWASAIFGGSCGCVKMWLFMTIVYFQMFVLTALNIIPPIMWTAGAGSLTQTSVFISLMESAAASWFDFITAKLA